jgi:ABC-2 type transport system ATP-binding protein
MVLGLIHRDAGSIKLFGRDPARDPIRALAGVAGIIEEPRFYPYLSGRANLELLAALDRGGVGRREIDEILELVELRERRPRSSRRVLAGDTPATGDRFVFDSPPAPALMLDEPANGVDPAGIRFLRALIRRLSDDV